MNTQTFLKISTPCQESWNQMSEKASGRFCGSCQHEVIDFSVMTDQQIISYLATANTKTCGRFADNQLSRELVPNKQIIKKNWQWLLAAITGLIFSSEKTMAANIYKQVNYIGMTNLIEKNPLKDTSLTPILQSGEKMKHDLNGGINEGPMIMGKLEIFGKLDVQCNVVSLAKKMLGQDLFTAKIDKKQMHIQPKYAGKYLVELYNADSKLINHNNIHTSKNKEMIILEIDKNVEPGNYYIRLVNVIDSKKETVKKISV